MTARPALTPYEQARAVYASEPCARTFEEDLQLHFLNGFVFSTPGYFIMGRPVDRHADPAEIVNPERVFDGACPHNCWHVYLMAGEAAGKVWEIMPWWLPWISYERKNELRFMDTRRAIQFSKLNISKL